MQFKLPESLVDVSVFVDGLGFIGTVEADGIKFPAIEELEESVKSGGFEQSYSTGVFKKLEFEVIIKEINKVIFQSVANGLNNGKGITLTIKGSTIQDGIKTGIVATIQSKPSIAIEKAQTTLKGTATFFSFEYGGSELCMFDTKNMIAKISGVDYLQALRTHIG